MSQEENLIDLIMADHRAVEDVFKDLEKGDGPPDHRRTLADHAITELVRHSVAEEMYLYPAARTRLPNGDEIADHEIEEHGEAEQVMKELEGLPATEAKFATLIDQLISDVRHHIAEEESDLLPKLQEACSADELMELGKKVADAKKLAPTRPHPSSPDTPPANKILGPGVGLVDRLRDALSSS